MKHLVLILGALLFVSLGGLYFSVKHSGALAEELQTSEKARAGLVAARKHDEATLVARHREIVATGRKLAEAQEALSEALQANSGWSDTLVPTEVFKALTGDSDASKSGRN